MLLRKSLGILINRNNTVPNRSANTIGTAFAPERYTNIESKYLLDLKTYS